MIIHGNFIGGNITVSGQDGSTVYIENQLRDTAEDWFYWAFCVEGAAGEELTFRMQKYRLGYWGPAISYDRINWHWLGERNGDSFSYKFAENENKVYFAHSMLYHPDRFLRLCEELSLPVSELCISRKGRSVPLLTFGDGKRNLILTARHHACESTGSYVLEGVLRELSQNLPDSLRVFCVPFVDYDGVIDGDQGKARAPHDHNRDYLGGKSLYPETAAIQRFADAYGCHYGFDFHSPWHCSGENDHVFLVRNSKIKEDRIERFSRILSGETLPTSMQYFTENDHPPMTGWNQPSSNFSFTMMHRPECDLAVTLETCYFGTQSDPVSPGKLTELGRCFARSLLKYIGQDTE